MKITQQQQMYYNKNRTGEGKTKLNLSLKHMSVSQVQCL